jgi:hypothetical protein
MKKVIAQSTDGKSERFESVEDAATRFQVSGWTIKNYISSGDLFKRMYFLDYLFDTDSISKGKSLATKCITDLKAFARAEDL